MDQDASKMSDHDLLVGMHSTLKRAVEDIKALDMKVTDFNNNYAKKADVDSWKKDHEDRIRRLEFWGAILVGISYALQFYFNFIRK